MPATRCSVTGFSSTRLYTWQQPGGQGQLALVVLMHALVTRLGRQRLFIVLRGANWKHVPLCEVVNRLMCLVVLAAVCSAYASLRAAVDQKSAQPRPGPARQPAYG